jgi:hypothetical protein
MCGATKGGLSVEGIDLTKEAVIQGRVLRGGDPVAGAYVRLLDATGEFTGDGSWTIRTLAPGARTDRTVVAARGTVSEIDVELEAA